MFILRCHPGFQDIICCDLRTQEQSQFLVNLTYRHFSGIMPAPNATGPFGKVGKVWNLWVPGHSWICDSSQGSYLLFGSGGLLWAWVGIQKKTNTTWWSKHYPTLPEKRNYLENTVCCLLLPAMLQGSPMSSIDEDHLPSEQRARIARMTVIDESTKDAILGMSKASDMDYAERKRQYAAM